MWKNGNMWKLCGKTWTNLESIWNTWKIWGQKNNKVCGTYVENGTCIDIEYFYPFSGFVKHEKGTNFLFLRDKKMAGTKIMVSHETCRLCRWVN